VGCLSSLDDIILVLVEHQRHFLPGISRTANTTTTVAVLSPFHGDSRLSPDRPYFREHQGSRVSAVHPPPPSCSSPNPSPSRLSLHESKLAFRARKLSVSQVDILFADKTICFLPPQEPLTLSSSWKRFNFLPSSLWLSELLGKLYLIIIIATQKASLFIGKPAGCS
jgi:hypothetical protein